MGRVAKEWSKAEEGLLIEFMFNGISNGVGIGNLLKQFCETYKLTDYNVKNKWKSLSVKYDNVLTVAKLNWITYGKPEKLAKAKAEKAMLKSMTVKSKGTTKKRQVRIPTGQSVQPKDKGRMVKVDISGVVELV